MYSNLPWKTSPEISNVVCVFYPRFYWSTVKGFHFFPIFKNKEAEKNYIKKFGKEPCLDLCPNNKGWHEYNIYEVIEEMYFTVNNNPKYKHLFDFMLYANQPEVL